LLGKLVAQQRHVRGVSRTGTGIPEGVENVRAVLMDQSAAIAASDGASVIHMAANVPYPEWLSKFPTMIDNAIAAVEAAGAKLILADNLYAYGPVNGPITEQTPERPVGATRSIRPHLAGRPCPWPGAGHHRPRKRLLRTRRPHVAPRRNGARTLSRGKRPLWFAPLHLPHTFGYSVDTAKALVLLGDDDRADGRIGHTPAAETLTISDFITLGGNVSGRVRRPLRLPAVTTRAMALFDRRLRGYEEMGASTHRPLDRRSLGIRPDLRLLQDHQPRSSHGRHHRMVPP